MLRKYLNDIKTKTADMNTREKVSYVATYYWYHILIVISAAALIFFALRFYLFGNQKPEYTCVIVNQGTEDELTAEIARCFAEENELDPELVTVDADYVFSYGDVEVKGANESSYEKFFFKWRNEEIDAVILPESMYAFCREMRGEFRTLEDVDTSGFETYEEDGAVTAVVVGQGDPLMAGEPGERLLLAFPDNGKHGDLCEAFLNCVGEFQNELGGNE